MLESHLNKHGEIVSFKINPRICRLLYLKELNNETVIGDMIDIMQKLNNCLINLPQLK